MSPPRDSPFINSSPPIPILFPPPRAFWCVTFHLLIAHRYLLIFVVPFVTVLVLVLEDRGWLWFTNSRFHFPPDLLPVFPSALLHSLFHFELAYSFDFI